MTYWFTADCHFHHTNIIKYCNRPFATVEQMNEVLISNWRNTVKPDDIVFHIGDFCFANKEITGRIINVLTGNIIFLKGNHEGHPKSIIESLIIRYEGHSIHLNHYPERANPLMVSLCGHVHEKWLIHYHYICQIDKLPIHISARFQNEPTKEKGFPIINVGVDRWDYHPVSFDKIEKLIRGKYDEKKPD